MFIYVCSATHFTSSRTTQHCNQLSSNTHTCWHPAILQGRRSYDTVTPPGQQLQDPQDEDYAHNLLRTVLADRIRSVKQEAGQELSRRKDAASPGSSSGPAFSSSFEDAGAVKDEDDEDFMPSRASSKRYGPLGNDAAPGSLVQPKHPADAANELRTTVPCCY